MALPQRQMPPPADIQTLVRSIHGTVNAIRAKKREFNESATDFDETYLSRTLLKKPLEAFIAGNLLDEEERTVVTIAATELTPLTTFKSELEAEFKKWMSADHECPFSQESYLALLSKTKNEIKEKITAAEAELKAVRDQPEADQDQNKKKQHEHTIEFWTQKMQACSTMQTKMHQELKECKERADQQLKLLKQRELFDSIHGNYKGKRQLKHLFRRNKELGVKGGQHIWYPVAGVSPLSQKENDASLSISSGLSDDDLKRIFDASQSGLIQCDDFPGVILEALPDGSIRPSPNCENLEKARIACFMLAAIKNGSRDLRINYNTKDLPQEDPSDSKKSKARFRRKYSEILENCRLAEMNGFTLEAGPGVLTFLENAYKSKYISKDEYEGAHAQFTAFAEKKKERESLPRPADGHSSHSL